MPRLSRILPLIFIAGLLGAAQPGRAQTRDSAARLGSVRSGQWVRVHDSTATTYEGRLVRVASDLLVLVRPGSGDTVTVRGMAGTQVWVSRHDSRRTLAGMGIGVLGGATAGAIAANAGYKRCGSGDESCWNIFSRGDMMVAGAVAGGAIGLLLGAGIGSTIVSHDWRPLDTSATATVEPDRGSGVAVVLRLRF
jgi:hypothetical protein